MTRCYTWPVLSRKTYTSRGRLRVLPGSQCSEPAAVLQDARNAFRDHEGSPSESPKRRGRQQEQGDSKRDKLEEYMRKVEQQMKTRFLAKIFTQEEDLRKLEAAAQVEEQQQRRAQFRAQQLKQLEERKLDCRVGLAFSPCLPFLCLDHLSAISWALCMLERLLALLQKSTAVSCAIHVRLF